MTRVQKITLWAALVAIVLGSSAQAAQDYVTGLVYNDINRNALLDAGEKGLSGVRVSNGQEIVKTDYNGRYRLPISDAAIIFLIKPRNWITNFDGNNLPEFYYIHKPKGSAQLKFKGVDPTGSLPASVNFPLYPHHESDKFKAVFFADTQVRDPLEISYLSHSIIEELVGTDAAFGVTLGDIAFNDLSVYDSLIAAIGKIGIPWYNVAGNHDTNFDGTPVMGRILQTFERVFGPSHYSYDYGPVHFVVINDIFWPDNKHYIAQLDDGQMTFLRNDLAMVSKCQLVVLMMHVPIVNLSNQREIYKLLKIHPNTFSISGHLHKQQHFFISRTDGWDGKIPLHHLACGAACGSMWSGIPDADGVPPTLMSDGTPNGYSFITFNKTQYSIEYKVARRPDSYQMRIYAPDEVKASEIAKAEVSVNIFMGSERSIVDMRLDNDASWFRMQRVEREDPYVLSNQMWKVLDARNAKPAPICKHIWCINLPANTHVGTHLINLRATDMFGHTYTGKRVISIR